MRPDTIAGLIAAGLTLAACSPEAPPRDASAGTADAAVDTKDDRTAKDLPAAAETTPAEQPAAERETGIDPDPQVGVELPEPPVRVPEDPPAR